MLSLTRKASYGLIAMAHLARRGGKRSSAREIARENRLPVSLLMNVMKRLCAAGYVHSVRGAAGGYTLARRPEDIIIGPLLDEIEGPVEDARCKRGDDGLEPRPPGQPCPDADTCPHGDPVHRVHRKLRDFLQNVTLADIMSSQRDMPPSAAEGIGAGDGPKETEDDA
jgi:Rrf2 family protein